MKKLLALAAMALALSACERLDYGNCITGHNYDSSYIMYQQVGDISMPIFINQTSWTCDVWEYPDGHGPKYKPE